jgi:DNA-binding transcriptional ArsR family regulator
MTERDADRGPIRADGEGPDRGVAPALLAATPHIQMSLAPLATVTVLLMNAVGGRRSAPRAWTGPVRSALSVEDRALLGPLFASDGTTYMPDSLLPKPTRFATTFEEERERVASTPADQFLAELASEGLLESPWLAAARSPRRWLGAYVAALQRAWTAVGPLWDRAQPLLEREADRVGAALVRRTGDLLLCGLSPRLDVVAGQLVVHQEQAPLRFAPDLVVVPVVCGPRGLFLTGWLEAVDEFAYPLPGAHRLQSHVGRGPDPASLEALLREPRAGLLRRLERSTTAGRLAAAMHYAPSAISYHLASLEDMGLVERERTGRHVLIHRTARGTALVHLYAD